MPKLAVDCHRVAPAIRGCTHVRASKHSIPVAQLTANGTLDARFGTRGQTVTTFPGFQPFAFGLAQEGDGKLLLCGEALPTQ